jgi:hypothetical protein
VWARHIGRLLGITQGTIFLSFSIHTRLANHSPTEQHVDPLTIFIIVSFKDFLLPFLFAHFFSNPLAKTTSALSAAQQWLAIVAIAAYFIADAWPDSSEKAHSKNG